jgi:small subunit ribosomal protein S8
MLTRIRNACRAKHRRVDMPASKVKAQIAQILKENSYIQDFRTLETEEGRQILRVILKYAVGTGQPVIRDLQRVSTPGLRRYVGVTEIPRVRNGLGMAILSTSQGVMSDRQARQRRTGGELVALVW